MFVFLFVTNIFGQSFIVPVSVTPPNIPTIQSEFGFLNRFSTNPMMKKPDEDDHVSGCYFAVCHA